jgi:RNA polymerase sigma-70 factor (ECF subfamily)
METKAIRHLKDKDLIAASLQGDDNAFKELVRRYQAIVTGTISGMIGNCPEVDDVAQETFIRFYRSLASFRQEASVKTYITRIAINQSLEELKKRKRKSLVFFQRQPVEELNLVDDSSGSVYDDRHEIIQKAISELDPKSKAVIVLRLIDGYSTKETAEILNVPLGTVLSRLARAQTKLLKLLSSFRETDDVSQKSQTAFSFI